MAPLSDVVGGFKGEYAEKGLKFLAVSAFNVVFGQGLLVLANAGFGWSFVPSNVFAVGISTGPAYVFSRTLAVSAHRSSSSDALSTWAFV